MVETATDPVSSSEKPVGSPGKTDSAITNGVRLVGESFLPGASLLMEGKLLNGAAHAVVGLGFRAVLGPAGFLLAAADSYSKVVSDKYLWDHVSDLVGKRRDAPPAATTSASAEAPPAAASAGA